MKSNAKKKHVKSNKFSLRNIVIVAGLFVFASIGAYLQSRSDAATPLAAGHVPGRVLLGMASSESMSPRYAEALQITGPVYERRQFTPSWITTSNMNSMLNECETNNQYCVISFKVPNNDWVGVTQGAYNSGLDTAMSVARSRTKPFAFGVHHEPTNDGLPENWAKMQEYLVAYLAPVNDKMAFTTIANGFHWGPNQGSGAAVQSSYYPDSLVSKMNQYKGIMAADFYDAKPRADGTYAANADRTSMKIQGFVNWARQKGVKAIGVGEFGTTTATELNKSWGVMKANKDFFVYANYFNSLANSNYDWRLIPDSYPVKDASNPLDLGGTPESEARLNAFKAAVAESLTMAPTEPTPTPTPANVAPSIPQSLGAVAGDNSVATSWSPSSDTDGTVTGYELRYKSTSSTTWGSPIAVSGTSRTVTGLTNGSSYDFQVRSKDNGGLYSAYSTTKSATPVAPVVVDPTPTPTPQSDLVVTSLTWSPTNPRNKQKVTFSATIKNQGTGSTPAGVIHGIAFSVGGVKQTWSSNHTTSIAPGASVTLSASGGLNGTSTWSATTGTHSVEAFVDDATRITELNETNNKMTKSLGAADIQKPSKPGKPNAVLATDTQVALDWSNSTDDTTVASYDVYRDGTLIAATTDSSYTDSNLTSGTTYTYKVVAIDSAGNISDASEVLGVSTTAPSAAQTPGGDAPLVITPENTSTPVSIPANNQPVVTGTIELNNSGATGETTTVLVDGKLIKTVDGTAATIDTSTFPDGVHTVTLQTENADGAIATTSRIVTIDNDLNVLEKLRNTILSPLAGKYSASTMDLGLMSTAILLGFSIAAGVHLIRSNKIGRFAKRK